MGKFWEQYPPTGPNDISTGGIETLAFSVHAGTGDEFKCNQVRLVYS